MNKYCIICGAKNDEMDKKCENGHFEMEQMGKIMINLQSKIDQKCDEMKRKKERNTIVWTLLVDRFVKLEDARLKVVMINGERMRIKTADGLYVFVVKNTFTIEMDGKVINSEDAIVEQVAMILNLD